MAGRGDIRAGRAFVELFLRNNAFIRGLKDVRYHVANVGRDMQAMGRQMVGVGLAVGAPLAAAVKRFAEFDDAIRAVQAVTGAAEADFLRLTETAKRLGATTSYTAVQVAALMTELGRAGFAPQQIEDMTGAVLDLARATGTDATLASGIMAASIRQFGLGAADATRVADALTIAANKSFNTVEQLGQALQYAGPVASDFGMAIEDTLAILGGLGNVGIQGSMAGSALRRLLTLTGAEAEKLRAIFGVSFTDAAGDARPLVDVLDEVNRATADLGSAERAQKFNDAFGLLGITAASAIGKGIGPIKDLRKELDVSAGAAETAAKKMDAGLGGSFRILLSAAEGVAIGIGESLEPAIKRLADQATEIAGRMLAWIKQNREVIVTVAKTAAALVLAGGAVMGLGLAFSGVATVIGGFLSVAGMLSAILGAIATPVGAIVAAGVALVAVFVKLSGLTGYLSQQLSTLWGSLKAIASLLMAGEFRQAWQVAKLTMLAMGSAMFDMMSQLPKFAAYAAGRAARALVDGFKSAFSWITAAIGSVFNALISSAKTIGTQILTALLTGDISGIADQLKATITRQLSLLSESALAAVSGWEGGPAPVFAASERTMALRRQLAASMRQAKPASSVPATAAPGGSAATPSGPGAASSRGTRPPGEPLERPDIAASDIQKYRDRMLELNAARHAGVITEQEYRLALSQVRAEMLGLKDPLGDYRERTQLLQAALRDGTISLREFHREMAAAKDSLRDSMIDPEMAAKVEAIIERSKTPLQKFREQITETRDFFRRGLITREQFAAEQERLQKEYRDATQPAKTERQMSVSFSGAALMAQGAAGGAQQRLADEMRRSATAAEETRTHTREARDGIAGLRDDVRSVLPFKWR